MFSLALAVAIATSSEPPAAQPARPPQSNERICRGGGQRSLGSHIRTRRRCMTAEEWAREDEARSAPVPGMLVTQGQNDGRATPTPQ
jgi:hypothetical protein